MFANPEVSAFIDRLIGGQIPRGGTPPPTPGYRGALARGLLGDITQPSIRAPAPAPAIERYRHPLMQPLPTEGVGRQSGSGAPGEAEFRGGGGNTGASGLAGGIGKLGQGIEGAAEAIAANKQAADEKAALSQGGGFPKYGGGVSGAADTTGGGTGGQAPPIFSQPGPSARTGTGSYESPNAGLFQQLVAAYQGHGWSLQQAVNIASVQLRGEGAGLGSGGADAASGGSNGLSQWSADRWNKGVNWMKANGYDPRSVEGQTAWTTQELRTAYKHVDPSSVSSLVNNYESPRSDLRAGEIARSQNFAAAHASPNLAAVDAAQDAKQDAGDFAKATPSSASTTPPVQPGGPTQTGVYGGQPYTFQTQPAIGPQGMLQPPQDPGQGVNLLALALAGGQMPPIDPNFGGGIGLFG
jgi:hypothetical protein